MKNVDAIISGTGQTGPSLTERFASAAPLSNGHKFGYSTFDEEVCCEKTNLVLLGAAIWSLGESLSEQSSFEEGG